MGERMNRRGFLAGLICAPALVRTGILMPVKTIAPLKTGMVLLTPAQWTMVGLPDWDLRDWDLSKITSFELMRGYL
jgi:hypothetical protein